MDQETVVYLALLNAIEDAGSARKFALAHGFSPTYISQVTLQRVKPSPRLLAVLGFEKVTEIVKVGD